MAILSKNKKMQLRRLNFFLTQPIDKIDVIFMRIFLYKGVEMYFEISKQTA